MFFCVLTPLQTSEIIDLWGIIGSIFLGLVATIIALLTLRQNSKMLEESTRPYICITFDPIRITSYVPRFVVKNYGQTGAHITEFRYPEILNDCDLGSDTFNKQFGLVKGLFLAPHQSFSISLFQIPKDINVIDFSISYKTDKRKFSESFKLYVGDSPLHYSIKSGIDNGKELKVIAQSLLAICERTEN